MGENVYNFFFQAEDGIRDDLVTGVQTCALLLGVTDSLFGSYCLFVFMALLLYHSSAKSKSRIKML